MHGGRHSASARLACVCDRGVGAQRGSYRCVSFPGVSKRSRTNSTTADVIVGKSIASATFTNTAEGWIEVCKNADPPTYTNSFEFTVDGGTPFWVQAGKCSGAIQAYAGYNTIQEIQNNADFSLSGVTATAYPLGNALVTGPSANGTVVVEVQFGGVGGETGPTFTNTVQTGEFKICTQESSADANLAGAKFRYDSSYTVYGTSPTSGTVNLTEPAYGSPSACSNFISGIPTVNPDGTVPQVTVTSRKPKVTDVQVDTIAYRGRGTVISQSTTPATFPAKLVYSIGGGTNISSFTNGT